MNERPEPAIRIRVDVTNPGQFFACCGLLELAERIWRRSLNSWFSDGYFFIAINDGATHHETLDKLLNGLPGLSLKQLEAENEGASPMHVAVGCGLRLDWWQDSTSGGQKLKTWAGSQNGFRIAMAMQKSIGTTTASPEDRLSYSTVVYDPEAPTKKVEPFYFDARRGARPFARDIGFSPDALQMTTPAFPAVEFLCLVGLQRCRPQPTGHARVFDYFTWCIPLPTDTLPAAVCGLLPAVGAQGYRFENAFRTDQKKHKAFSPAVPLSRKPL